MPKFLILQKFQTSLNKTKIQKRDFSNFNSDDFFSDLNNMRIQQQIQWCNIYKVFGLSGK